MTRRRRRAVYEKLRWRLAHLITVFTAVEGLAHRRPHAIERFLGAKCHSSIRTPSSEMNRVAQIFLMLHLLRCCLSALRYRCRRPTGQELIAMGGRLSEAGPGLRAGVYGVGVPRTKDTRSPDHLDGKR